MKWLTLIAFWWAAGMTVLWFLSLKNLFELQDEVDRLAKNLFLSRRDASYYRTQTSDARAGQAHSLRLAGHWWHRWLKAERLAALRGNRLDEAQQIAARIEKLATEYVVAHFDPEGDVKATIEAGKDATPA